MTIGKRFLCAALAALLALFLLVGCAKEGEDYPFDSLLSDGGSSVTHYRVVVASECSPALYAKAKELADSLAERFSFGVSLVFDHEEVADKRVPEILLGETDRALSRQWLEPLRLRDYLCRTDGEGTVVIGGRTDDATLLALDRFCREILPAATEEKLMHEDGGFLYEAEYDCTSVLLNGFSLPLYRIALPDGGDPALWELVTLVRDRIAERSGYVLTVCEESELKETEKAIVLKTLPREEQEYLAYISPDARGIAISSNGIFGFSVALSRWEELLFSDVSEGVYTCDIRQTRSIAYEQDEYRFGSLQGSHLAPFDTLSELALLVSPIQTHLPDLVALDSLDGETAARLRDSLTHRGYRLTELAEGEQVCSLERGQSVTERTPISTWEGGPTVTRYRVGSETYGIYLIFVHGSVSADGILELSELLSSSTLPTVVLIHTAEAGGEISFPDANSHGLRALYHESYSAGAERHCFQCYATEGSLEVTLANRSDAAGYRDVLVKRQSIYSE